MAASNHPPYPKFIFNFSIFKSSSFPLNIPWRLCRQIRQKKSANQVSVSVSNKLFDKILRQFLTNLTEQATYEKICITAFSSNLHK